MVIRNSMIGNLIVKRKEDRINIHLSAFQDRVS